METTKSAPPHFAQCSAYRKALPTVVNGGVNLLASPTTEKTDDRESKGAIPKTGNLNSTLRPEQLQVTPWYSENSIEVAPSTTVTTDQNSYNPPQPARYIKEVIRPDLVSTRNSSVDSDTSRPSGLPRKALMDLRDAIALLDETCPNPDASPSLTPRTPRTPSTPYPSRNKRARSKSSDNSSNFSGDQKSTDNAKTAAKKRPFLRKIGISMTEERPFFSKLAPRIIGKPYLEKIGPSRAVEKPFLDKIGSSKTLDKFTFDLTRKEKALESATRSRNSIKRSRDRFLLKMYSFETEDIEGICDDRRDPLRGMSLDDVLDSNCALDTMNTFQSNANMKEQETRLSTMQLSSYETSPRQKQRARQMLQEGSQGFGSKETFRSEESVSSLFAREFGNTRSSPSRNKRQTSEDILDKKSERHEDFEKRGGSSDNLLTASSNHSIDSSRDSSVSRLELKEAFRQLQDEFGLQEIPTESYASFRRRTRGDIFVTTMMRRMADEKRDLQKKLEEQEEVKEVKVVRTRSVLRKQKGIDHGDQEVGIMELRKPQVIHEPSQETIQLLSELRKVKTLLRTPSVEKNLQDLKEPTKILITDKEFCLSVERENSVRRSSFKSSEKRETIFEKRCLSLDSVGMEKSQIQQNRTISLTSETEETIESSVLTPIGDSKSYCSDVFTSPSDDMNDVPKLEEDATEQNENVDNEIDIAIPVDQVGSAKIILQQSRTSDQYEIISPRKLPFKVKKRLGRVSVEERMQQESFGLDKVDCRALAIQKKNKCFPL